MNQLFRLLGDETDEIALSNMYVAGRNTSKELGLGHANNVLEFTQIPLLGTEQKEPDYLLFGSDHTIALATDGTTFGSGKNDTGQLGITSLAQRNRFGATNSAGTVYPVMNSPVTGDYQYQLAKGYSLLLGPTTTVGAGSCDSGELGDYLPAFPEITTDWVPSDISGTDVVCFSQAKIDEYDFTNPYPWVATIEVRAGVNTLVAYGDDIPTSTTSVGQTEDIELSVYFGSGVYEPLKVSSGARHGLIVFDDGGGYGELGIFGYNSDGQLGIGGDPVPPTNLAEVESIWDYLNETDNNYLYNWFYVPVDVWAGAYFSIIYVITSEDGTNYEYSFWVTGQNESGQLGLGDTDPRPYWTRLTALDSLQVRYVFVGLDTVVIQTHDDEIYAWGNGSEGTFGSGATDNLLVPTLLKQSSPTEVWDVRGHGYGKLALVRNGLRSNLKGWGANDDHELGIPWPFNNADYGASYYLPTYIKEFKVKSISIFSQGAFIVCTDGTMWRCGTFSSTSPASASASWVQVGSDTDWKCVACADGFYFACQVMAIKDDGTLWAFGDNSQWVLGVGYAPFITGGSTDDEDLVATPTQVGTDTDWDKVWIKNNSAFILKTNKSLWVSGENVNGFFGDLWSLNAGFYLGPAGQSPGTGALGTWGAPLQTGTSGLETWDEIIPDGMHIGAAYTFLGIKPGGSLYANGALVSRNPTNLGFSNYGYAATCDPLPVPGLTAVISACCNNAQELNTFVITDDGKLWRHHGVMSTLIAGVQSAMSATWIQVGTDTDWAKVFTLSLEPIIYLIKENGTLWVMYFDYTSPDVTPFDDWPMMGVPKTQPIVVNTLYQIGTGANYSAVAAESAQVIAMTTLIE